MYIDLLMSHTHTHTHTHKTFMSSPQKLSMKSKHTFIFFIFFCRSPLRMWRRRTLSSLNSVPSSSQKMWRMSWSRISLRSCSSCKWKTPFWVTISTVLQRLRCFWPPIQCRPNLVISARKSTGLDTWPQIASCPNGESYRTGLTGACAPGSIGFEFCHHCSSEFDFG